MKHIALRSKSIRRGDRPYTTPGLGDRVHSATCAYLYAKKHNTPVTLHITDDKWSVAGGELSQVKKDSWKEITNLFPDGLITVKPWPVGRWPKDNLKEDDWLKYLKDNGVDAEIFYYKDFIKMHPNETVVPLEMSQYFKTPALLPPIEKNINLPEKFVTFQFDATEAGRGFSDIMLNGLMNRYESAGYKILVVGGASKDKRFSGPGCLQNVGYAMSKASYHVGTDSGFLHMAMLYMPYNKIHIHNQGYKSHHLFRAVKLGAKLNPLGVK